MYRAEQHAASHAERESEMPAGERSPNKFPHKLRSLRKSKVSCQSRPRTKKTRKLNWCRTNFKCQLFAQGYIEYFHGCWDTTKQNPIKKVGIINNILFRTIYIFFVIKNIFQLVSIFPIPNIYIFTFQLFFSCNFCNL